ncbi:MAG TPA: outer membrane lipoprotein carrier protein LolA [Bacteroidales bacterium]|nr:outer membrane lipoprotein carrier protein LolA [Bacteroidales bacterium]
MIKRNIVFLLSLLTLSVSVKAQQDTKAGDILDKMAKENETVHSLSVDFSYTSKNQQTGDNYSQQGTMEIKGKKYKVKMDDNIIYFDGKNMWNYLPDEKEVTVTKFQEGDDDFFLTNPRKLFSIYKKDFKYQFVSEFAAGDHVRYEIDLIPKDHDQPYSRFKLFIDKNTYQLAGIQAFEKNGMIHTIELSNFKKNPEFKDESFTFNPAGHPDVRVEDMRF